MRRILAGVCVGLWGASLALAQSTTTTVAATSSTSIGTSTSTTSSTSTSIGCTDPTLTFETFDPRQCAQDEAFKDDCRVGCCTDAFDCLADSCNPNGLCDLGAWSDFRDEWARAGEFYKYCQNPEDPNLTEEFDIAARFVEFNVDDSCRQYPFGCKKAARRHVRQCADNDRCIGCCQTALVRWRAAAIRTVKRAGGGAFCKQAIRCLRRATSKGTACRNACRRKPTCGEDAFKRCLEKTSQGREVLECYGKCTEKCGNADAYRWCVQACQGLNDCQSFGECEEKFEVEAPAGCLFRGETDCVGITTTSTSSSSTTSTTSQTTTSTSSSTSTSSPLLVGPRLR
jgi:hypothetical protein